MAYPKTTWVIDTTPLSAANLNNLETQYELLASIFGPHSVLIAVADNTPVKLDVAASRIVGRKAAGNIVALTGAELAVILGRIGVANLEWTDTKLLKGAGAGVNPTEVVIGSGAGEVAEGDHSHALSEDVVGYAKSTLTCTSATGMFMGNHNIAASSDLDIATKTLDYAAGSLTVATGLLSGVGLGPNLKLRLYMGGVQVAESGILSSGWAVYLLVATRALSGSQECKIAVHNYDVIQKAYRLIAFSNNGTGAAGIGVGSVTI